MIEELLIFSILFQTSCGQTANYSGEYSYVTPTPTFEQMCLNGGGILVDRLQKICIPFHYRTWIQSNPNTQDIWGNIESLKTEIEIILTKVEIIEIADHTISLNMDVIIDWLDFRLILNTYGGLEKIYLSEEEQKQIWSPQILIASNVKSENMKGIQLGFSENIYAFASLPEIIARKKFHLSATIKCNLDFQNFPFDEHICYLEVS